MYDTCKFALNLLAYEGSICRTDNINDFSRTALTHTVLRIQVLVIGTNFTWKNAFDIYSDICGLIFIFFLLSLYFWCDAMHFGFRVCFFIKQNDKLFCENARNYRYIT